ADRGRGLFEADIGFEPRRQQIVEGLPPARIVGLLHQLQVDGELLRIVDTVELQQVQQITFPEPGTAQFEAADLGMRPADMLPRVLATDTARLPQLPQPATERYTQYGGPAIGFCLIREIGIVLLVSHDRLWPVRAVLHRTAPAADEPHRS